ncbi:hypothetical protein ACOMHN_045864 [Nucella lapillus]
MSNQQLPRAHKEILWRRFYLSRAKLKAVSRTSALLSGFAMVAMVEIQLDTSNPAAAAVESTAKLANATKNGHRIGSGDGSHAQPSSSSSYDSGATGAATATGKVPDALLIVYAVCTTLLVTVHLIALMISTCILPNLEAVSAEVVSPQAVSESPHEKMRHCVETAWICSTGVGILLFMVEIAVLAWVKFYLWSPGAAWASSAVVVPAALLFLVFSVLFYRRLLAHKHQRHEEDLRELQVMAHDLNCRSRNQNSLRVHLV